MASAPRSGSLDVRNQRPSFAKIAATGIKPPTAHHHTNSASNHFKPKDASSSPRDGSLIVTPSDANSQSSTPQYPSQVVQKDPQRSKEPGASSPQVRVQIVEPLPPRSSEPAPEGLLMPASDDVGTPISSSSGSNKPQSLDGKSVASGTTFALDEKDSLRPDDSASVQAVEEDEVFSGPSSGMLGSRLGSDDGVRAFHDQLREISSMEPQQRPPPPQIFGGGPKGVLYVPPLGPGIGPLPISSQPHLSAATPDGDALPDQKLLEALENPRDRVWVLKLEQDVIDFVKDPKESSLTLPQCHSFYRLLAHKMADYYMLGHLVEDSASAVRLYKTPNCRIPPPLTGITAPSTAASTPPPAAPQMKILRRGVDGPAIANGSNNSKNGSENGESGEDKPKAPATREEREARYEAARLRIMGSAKPTESPEASKEKQDSRSSSTTGKAKKKKQRADSDDGFEARSAYSNYYAPTFESAGMQVSAYGFPSFTDGAQAHYANIYGQQIQAQAAQQAALQMPGGNWQQAHYQNLDPNHWAPGPTSPFDLSASFQRALSIQPSAPMTAQSSNFGGVYGQQFYGVQQTWQQQQQQQQAQQQQQQQQPQQPQYPAVARPVQPEYGFPNTYTMSHQHNVQSEQQPYAFGQLPSQAYPGRPSSKSEHPLPGSYKASTGTNTATNSGFAAPALQRQSSSQSQGSTFGSPRHAHNSPHAMQSGRMPTQQPMTHPLPQPVFPRHPSPNMPLPPKPSAAPTQQQQIAPAASSSSTVSNQSLLAKWGTPASLPAKPPPTNEPLDPSLMRPAFVSAAAAARQPSSSGGGGGAGGTNFSATVGGGTQIVNGSGAAASKRGV